MNLLLFSSATKCSESTAGPTRDQLQTAWIQRHIRPPSQSGGDFTGRQYLRYSKLIWKLEKKEDISAWDIIILTRTIWNVNNGIQLRTASFWIIRLVSSTSRWKPEIRQPYVTTYIYVIFFLREVLLREKWIFLNALNSANVKCSWPYWRRAVCCTYTISST